MVRRLDGWSTVYGQQSTLDLTIGYDEGFARMPEDGWGLHRTEMVATSRPARPARLSRRARPVKCLRKISQAGNFSAVTEPPKGGDGPSPMRFAGLGIQLAVMMLAGLFAGQWADRKFGTGSLLTIVGAFLGFGATMWSLIRQLRRDGQGGQGGQDR